MPFGYTYMPFIQTCILNIHSRFKQILLFLTVSSILTAISGFFVTLVCYNFFLGPVDLKICFAVFLMAFSVYSLNKISDIDEDLINFPERVKLVRSHKNRVVQYSISSYIISLTLAYISNGVSSTLVLLVPIVVNALYSSHVFQGVPRLKDVPLMKNAVTALSWSTVATLLPALSLMKIQNISSLSVEFIPGMKDPLLLVVFYFIFIKGFINTVLYDVRDIDGDIKIGIKTIPVIFGTQKTCILLLGVNSMLLPCLILVSGCTRIFMAMFIFYGYASILYFKKRRDPIYLDLFVEGEWMNLYLLFIILKSLGLLF